MKTKILILILFVFVLTGCATFRRNQSASSNTNMLQTKVANLEEQAAARDQDIEELRSDVDRLNDRLDSQETRSDSSLSRRSQEAVLDRPSYAGSSDSGNGEDQIIRVPVSPERVQKALKSAGYYNGKIDGKIGQQTKAAIRDFQSNHDLKADGVIGKATWAALKTYVE